MDSYESKAQSDAEPLSSSGGIKGGFDVGVDGSKHSVADSDSDGGNAAPQRTRGSIGSSLSNGCGTGRSAAETSSSSDRRHYIWWCQC